MRRVTTRLCWLDYLRQRYSNQVHLVVLDIIRKWGRSDFHPSPKEVVHFAVIHPLQQELRQWLGRVTLVKVKSHTGCLLNERTDELAELGRQAENPEILPWPPKIRFFLVADPTSSKILDIEYQVS
jgi:ribonuclease HI